MAGSGALEKYHRAKEIVSGAAAQLIEISIERAYPELGKRMQDQIEKLQSVTFNLAVLGEFKRGKSTLINALIHEQLLPVAVIPLTSITTIIAHGEKTTIDVIFTDGHEQTIASSALKDYVTESENPDNCKNVDRVQITHPAVFLENGLRIIDTPGIGSAFTHNTKTTYDYLPQVDAAIFLFSADQPASQVELAFLEEILTCTAKVFLVQNKIDYLGAEDLQQSLAYLQTTIEKHLGAPVTIYPVSARAALLQRCGENINDDMTTGFVTLEKAISQFLLEGKAQTLIATTTNRLTKEISALKQLIALEQHSRTLPHEQLCQAIAAFAAAGEQIVQAQSDTEFIIKGETGKLLSEIEKHLQTFVEAHKEKLRADMNDCFVKNEKLSKGELIKILHQQLFNNLQEIFSRWRQVEEAEVGKAFAKITARFADQSNLIIDQIRKASAAHLGMEIDVHFELACLTTESRHHYAVNDPFTLAVETLPLLLPGALAKPIIRSRFMDAAGDELSRNAGRLRADFQERIEKTTREFLRQFKGQIALSLADISTVLERVAAQEKLSCEEITSCRNNLQRQLDSLASAQNKLDSLST